MGWEVGGRFNREATHVTLWLIHVVIWQKRTQHCKAIILQFKINLKIKKKKKGKHFRMPWMKRDVLKLL